MDDLIYVLVNSSALYGPGVLNLGRSERETRAP